MIAKGFEYWTKDLKVFCSISGARQTFNLSGDIQNYREPILSVFKSIALTTGGAKLSFLKQPIGTVCVAANLYLYIYMKIVVIGRIFEI